MKTVLYCFENKFNADGLSATVRAVNALEALAVFPDEAAALRGGEADFEERLNSSFDAAFIFCPQSAGFSVAEKLSEFGYSRVGAAYVNGSRFVAAVGDESAELSDLVKEYNGFFGFDHARQTFKLYGAEKEKIAAVTDEISAKYPSVRFYTKTEALDSETMLFYDGGASKIETDRAIREFITALKDFVYADESVSLEQRLNDLLRLRRLKISTAESMTGGAIAAKIVSIAGASDLFYEGLVTYNTSAKFERLGVNGRTVEKMGVVSSEVAYEMAAGLLNTRKCDCAITITGYAGATRDGRPDEGLCYIGIGACGEIEVHKFNFGGSRKQVIEKAANAALFLMIKTITNLQ